MSTRCYKKPSPKIPVYIGGTPIKFEAVNIEVGVYKTDDVNIQNAFATLQQRQVGGIFDITAEEYESIKKKQTSSPGSYRDELGKSFSQPRTPPPQDLVSHAAEENKPATPVPPAVTPPVEPQIEGKPKKPQPRPRKTS